MATLARMKKQAGGGGHAKAITVTAGGTVEIGNNGYRFLLSASSAVSLAATAITCPMIRPGRPVIFIGTSDTNTITITHTATASRASGTITGTGNVVLGLDDECRMEQRSDGSWTIVVTSLVS